MMTRWWYGEGEEWSLRDRRNWSYSSWRMMIGRGTRGGSEGMWQGERDGEGQWRSKEAMDAERARVDVWQRACHRQLR